MWNHSRAEVISAVETDTVEQGREKAGPGCVLRCWGISKSCLRSGDISENVQRRSFQQQQSSARGSRGLEEEWEPSHSVEGLARGSGKDLGFQWQGYPFCQCEVANAEHISVHAPASSLSPCSVF